MKPLLIILLLLMSVSFVVENVLLPELKATSQLLQDNDFDKGAEEEGENKKGEDLKVKWHFSYAASLHANFLSVTLPFAHLSLLFSSGYINQPYIPPDLA